MRSIIIQMNPIFNQVVPSDVIIEKVMEVTILAENIQPFM